MGSCFIITILCIIIYLLVWYEFFPAGTQQTRGRSDNSQDNDHSQVSKDDIMGKSSFDVNTELRKKREREEGRKRKEAIAKGEMTEDGKEIAQEVTMEDCEVEQKKVFVPVPVEEISKVLPIEDDEEPAEGYASGHTFNDLDLTLNKVRKDEIEEEEELQTSEVLYRFLADTEVLDEICNLAPVEGKRICRMIDRYKKEMSKGKEPQKEPDVSKTQEKPADTATVTPKRFTMAERYADFGLEDLV